MSVIQRVETLSLSGVRDRLSRLHGPGLGSLNITGADISPACGNPVEIRTAQFPAAFAILW